MSSNTQSVLVVEDEASIASFVSLYLKNAGYEVRTASNGNEALRSLEREQPSLVVLDLMLPDIDGIEICRRIRQKSDLPILMLTARDEDVDKIIGLEVGADDYMTKPFNPRELVARVKSILRRSTSESRTVDSEVIRHGILTVDAGRREARVGEDEIQLFVSYSHGQALRELNREATGMSLLYNQQAKNYIAGESVNTFAADTLAQVTGDSIYYVGTQLFPGQIDGLIVVHQRTIDFARVKAGKTYSFTWTPP